MEIRYEQLVNYWNGHADDDEVREVEAWKTDNAHLYAQWLKVWETAGKVAETHPADVDKAWARIGQKIQPARTAKTVPLHWGYAVAAAVSLLLLAFGWLWMNGEQTFKAEGQQAHLVLEDGSEVWLYPGSEISYPSFFWGKSHRTVKLRGEGFFQVARNEAKPFQVAGELGTVKVLGTEFLVESFPESGRQTVQVAEGKVAFFPAGNEEAQQILTKGEEATLQAGTNRISKTPITDANYRAWQTREITFEEVPLPEALRVIEKVYGIEIASEDATWKDCLFTGKFKQTPVDNMLNTIETLFGLELEKTGEKAYQLTGNGCL